MNKKVVGSTVLLIVVGVGVGIITGDDLPAGHQYIQFYADGGSLTPGPEEYEIIQVADSMDKFSGRCDNPQTQDDIDFCKAASSSGAVPAVRSAVCSDALGNSINAKIGSPYVLDDPQLDPPSIVTPTP